MKSKVKQLEEKVEALQKKVDELEKRQNPVWNWPYYVMFPYYVPQRYPVPMYPWYPVFTSTDSGTLTVTDGSAPLTVSNVEPNNFVCSTPDVPWSYTSQS